MRRRTAALWLSIAMLLLSSCGSHTTDDTAILTPPQIDEAGASDADQGPVDTKTAVNPLTGQPIEETWANARPIAVMLNNLTKALPQQGNGSADIIYEVVAEGGITRMLAVYQSLEGVGVLGSIRSARPYYIELALGHDAVYVHAGGSVQAYEDIKNWDVTSIDGVNGRYSYADAGIFWRDRDRIEGKKYDYEHSLITSGETLLDKLEQYGLQEAHAEGYTYTMNFTDDGTPKEGELAQTITVPFSNYKTGVFRYDAKNGTYLVEEYDAPYIDGNTGEQISVTNVLVLKTACDVIAGDTYGHMAVDLTGGDGWFACGGKIIPITWEKGVRTDQLSYFTLDGKQLALGIGKSYVNIIPETKEISYE